MKKHISRTLLIIILAVLFVPLFIIQVRASEEMPYIDTDVDLVRLKAFADSVYGAEGEKGDIWYHDYTLGASMNYKIYILLPEGREHDTITMVETTPAGYGERKYGSDGATLGPVFIHDFSENIGQVSYSSLHANINLAKSKQPIYVMSYDDWLANRYPEEELNIEDIGLPERTMDNYIVMAQMVEGKPGTIYYHEYMETPLFNVVSTIDAEKNIYNIGWTGHGLSRAYKYNKDTSSWEFVSESKATDNWQVAVSDKKIYRTNMQIPVSGTIPEYTFPEDPEGIDRIIITSPQVPINTINDRVKIYVRMDAEVKVETKEEILKVMGVPQAEIKKIKTWHSTSTKLQHINRFSEYEITLFMPELKQYNVTILANIPETKFFGIKLLDAKTISKDLVVTRREKVDLNQDGKDDTTGETGDFNYDNPITGDGSSPPNRSEYESTLIGQFQYLTDTLNYWITAPFRLIKDGVEYVAGQAEQMFSWANNFALMIGRLFSFLPSPVLGLLGMGFAVIILISVIKMLRG